MRVLLSALILGVAGTAQAGTWVFEFGPKIPATDWITAKSNVPFTHRLFILSSGEFWDVPDLTLDDAGEPFRLDATTADSYGFDWDQLSDFFAAGGINLAMFAKTIQPDTNWQDVWLGSIPLGPGAEIQSVDFHFSIKNAGPELSSLWSYATITAEGPAHPLPEPANAAMLYIGLCGMLLHRHHTPQPARRQLSRS